MTTKTEVVETLADKMAKMRAELWAAAITAPEVTGLAKQIFDKTTKWGADAGLGKASSKSSAKAIEMGKKLDDITEHGTKYGSSDMSTGELFVIKEMFETYIGEEIPVKKLDGNPSKKLTFLAGTAVILVTNKTDHRYPMNEVVFVVENGKPIAITNNGITPPSDGFYFDPYPASIKLPTEQEILDALATLYSINPNQFTRLSGMV